MSYLEQIRTAIHEGREITYTYRRLNRAIGERTGVPYVVYRAKSGSLLIDIWKTGGAPTDPSRQLPAWHSYMLEGIAVVRVGDKVPNPPKFSLYPPRKYEMVIYRPGVA